MENTPSSQELSCPNKILVEQFSEHLDTMIAQRIYASQTAQCYIADVQQLEKWLHKPFSHVTNQDLVEYIDGLRANLPLSHATIARKIASLRNFYRWLEKQGQIYSLPFDLLKSPAKRIAPRKELQQTDILQLMTQMTDENIYELRDKCIFSLILHCGFKPTYLVGLTINDLNLEKQEITIRQKYTFKSRFDISPVTALMSRYLLMRKTEGETITPGTILFPNKFGGSLSTRSIRRKLKNYLKKAGLDSSINPRKLRHSYALASLHHGEDIHELQKKLGHQNLSTTKIYSRDAKCIEIPESV